MQLLLLLVYSVFLTGRSGQTRRRISNNLVQNLPLDVEGKRKKKKKRKDPFVNDVDSMRPCGANGNL